MNELRVRILKDGSIGNGPVVYWMQRDQRADDNWALIYAQEIALKTNNPLIVVFNLVDSFIGAGLRQYYFMIEGLKDVEQRLNCYNIPFVILIGNPKEEIPKYLKEVNASLLVADFNPLKIIRRWKKEVFDFINIPFRQVDAHNIVPLWIASDKQEFAAYTIRPKITKLLNEFLTDFPELIKTNVNWEYKKEINWDLLYSVIKVDKSVSIINSVIPGSRAAIKELNNFFNYKYDKYAELRNDPTKDYQSALSPYLHFGQISAQKVAYLSSLQDVNSESKKAFLEELIIRRELADNFCYYNTRYDSVDSFPDWAKKSLKEHEKDKREYLYVLEEFEHAHTKDRLWNAAQKEMLKNGKMHGYMRMYWAKKILEWTDTPEVAMETAIYLNDKYQLDGRDPNGYAGIAWSIGGVHDRPWFDREVFGKIRYMNYNGCAKKFDVETYINNSVKF
ncbi:MAG TPA: deoxyribodipyrimidine photo-lyase [Melioribacteraceae bacterium]|nr:deoxyribodipyrimidine photo-lyase [Melioribacteraceae bacterium]